MSSRRPRDPPRPAAASRAAAPAVDAIFEWGRLTAKLPAERLDELRRAREEREQKQREQKQREREAEAEENAKVLSEERGRSERLVAALFGEEEELARRVAMLGRSRSSDLDVVVERARGTAKAVLGAIPRDQRKKASERAAAVSSGPIAPMPGAPMPAAPAAPPAPRPVAPRAGRSEQKLRDALMPSEDDGKAAETIEQKDEVELHKPWRWWHDSAPADRSSRFALTEKQKAYGFEAVSAGGWAAADPANTQVRGATKDGNGNQEYQVYTKSHVEVSDKGEVALRLSRLPEDELGPVREAAMAAVQQDAGWDRLPEEEMMRRWQYQAGKVVHDNGGEGFGLGTMTFTAQNPWRLPFGSWPSVWLLGENWPVGAEIDMLEMLPLDAPDPWDRRTWMEPRKLSTATHWGWDPTERQFVKGEVRVVDFGDEIEFKMTRTETDITVYARTVQDPVELFESDAATTRARARGGPKSWESWIELGYVDLTDFPRVVKDEYGTRVERGDISEAVKDSKMKLIANVAFAADGLSQRFGGVEFTASPALFNPLFPEGGAEWRLSKFGWKPRDSAKYGVGEIGLPGPEQDELH